MARTESLPPDVPGESTVLDAGDVDLHVVRAGPEDGPTVVLLHGFPEFWYGWHRAIEPLSEAGYRVVVPDQRGYNLSGRPGSVGAYTVGTLAGDVVGLVDALGRESVHLAGHDWGGLVGWWVALHHPDRLSSLAAVNAPHPSVIREALTSRPAQWLRTWYAVSFQLPVLPELVSRAGDWWLPVRSMRRSARPGAFEEADFERYRTAWSRPGAFTAMLNWYRANARSRPTPDRETVSVPTLVCWGTRDEYLPTEFSWESLAYCPEGELRLFGDATHWVTHEAPADLAGAMREFFG